MTAQVVFEARNNRGKQENSGFVWTCARRRRPSATMPGRWGGQSQSRCSGVHTAVRRAWRERGTKNEHEPFPERTLTCPGRKAATSEKND